MITKSLMFQLSVIIVLIASGALAGFGYYRYQIESSDSREHLQEELTFSTERLATSLDTPLYSFHDEGIRDVILSEMNYPDIVGIYIVDTGLSEQNYLYSKNANGKPVTVSAIPDEGANVISSTLPIVHDSEEIGKVIVYFTTKHVDKELEDKLMSIIIQIIILDVLLIIFVIIILRVKVVRPISNLKAGAQEIANGNLNQNIETKGKDEIAELGKAFNTMTNNLKTSRIKIERYSIDLEKQVMQRTKELDEKVTKLKISETAAINTMEHLNNALEQRKRVVNALRKERDRAQLYLDIASVMFVAISLEGVVTMVNRRGCEILGYPEEEIVGKNWYENFVPDRIKEEIQPRSRQLLAGNIQSTEYYETPIKNKDEKERMIAWHNTIIRGEKGNVIGLLSSGEDITERKYAEEALNKTVHDLERFNKLAVGRELQMVELKHEVNDLMDSLGRAEKYEIRTMKDVKNKLE